MADITSGAGINCLQDDTFLKTFISLIIFARLLALFSS